MHGTEMENQFFSTSQVAEMLNVPMRKIIGYTERGYLEASVVGPSGYGSRRLWSTFDLKKIDILRRCEDFGLSPKFLRRLCSLLEEETIGSWANLIIDCEGNALNDESAPVDPFPDTDRSPYLYIRNQLPITSFYHEQ